MEYSNIFSLNIFKYVSSSVDGGNPMLELIDTNSPSPTGADDEGSIFTMEEGSGHNSSSVEKTDFEWHRSEKEADRTDEPKGQSQEQDEPKGQSQEQDGTNEINYKWNDSEVETLLDQSEPSHEPLYQGIDFFASREEGTTEDRPASIVTDYYPDTQIQENVNLSDLGAGVGSWNPNLNDLRSNPPLEAGERRKVSSRYNDLTRKASAVVRHIEDSENVLDERQSSRKTVSWSDAPTRERYLHNRLSLCIANGIYMGTKFTPKVDGSGIKRRPSVIDVPHTVHYSFKIDLPSNSAAGEFEVAKSFDQNVSYTEVDQVRTIPRTRYYRGPKLVDYLDDLSLLEHNQLVYNEECDDHLYAPEFYLVECGDYQDASGKMLRERFNKTRRALCPFCPTLEFFLVNVSSYGQHMSQHHGVLSDGYLMPNPVNPGKYLLAKPNTQRRTKAKPRNAKGVICPVCYTVVEVEASAKTRERQPMMGYLTHFRSIHNSADKKKGTIKSDPKLIDPSLFQKFRRFSMSPDNDVS